MKNKKAVWNVIFGIIFTIIIISIFSYAAVKLFSWSDDKRVMESFSDFVDKVEKIGKSPDGTKDSIVVYLKDGYGIIGFSGEGSLESYRTPDPLGVEGGKFADYYFKIPRSPECSGVNSCICIYDFGSEINNLEPVIPSIEKASMPTFEMDLPPASVGDSHFMLHQCVLSTAQLPQSMMYKIREMETGISSTTKLYYFLTKGFLFMEEREFPGPGIPSLKTRLTSITLMKKDGNVHVCLTNDCSPHDSTGEPEMVINV